MPSAQWRQAAERGAAAALHWQRADRVGRASSVPSGVQRPSAEMPLRLKSVANPGFIPRHPPTRGLLFAAPAGLQPLAALSWVRQHQNAYAETGAAALNLVLPDQIQGSLRSSLGVRTLRPFPVGGMQWAFESLAASSHELTTARSVNASLATSPG